MKELRGREYTPEDRIRLLFDPDGLSLKRHAGIITGTGKIEGIAAFSYADDFMLHGGALGKESAGEIVRTLDMAYKAKAPFIALIDSAGASIAEGISSLDGFGMIFSRIIKYSGSIPMIAVVLGNSAGGASYAPALMDAVLVGGVDIASPLVISGFSSLSVIGRNKAVPFMAGRDGITLSDASCFFFVTRENISGLPVAITGYGERSDGYSMSAPEPDGVSVIEAIDEALQSASLAYSDIDYINLHGTGTKQNDAMEMKVLSKLFPGVYASSTKAYTGHTLASAGALEIAITAFSIAHSDKYPMPPMKVEGEADEGCSAFAFPPGRAVKVDRAMSFSFAFGGSDAVVILERIRWCVFRLLEKVRSRR